MKAYYELDIDFALLKEQKEIFIRMIMDWGEADDEYQRKEAEQAEGILEVLDAIQEQAVEVHGQPENEVFKTNK